MAHFTTPAHIITGTRILNEAAPYLKAMGNKAFVVTGKHLAVSEMMTTGAAEDMDDDKTAAESFIASLQEICDICEIPTPEQYGINKEEYDSQIDKMAADAIASGSPGNTCRTVTVDDCRQIYKKLYT